MTIYEAIEKRRSIRRYKPDDVPQAVLEKVLNAARLAPSGCNRQARKFIVVRDKETKSKLANASPYRFPSPKEKLDTEADSKFEEAPVVIVGCCLVQDADMRYFGSKDEDFIIFSNVAQEKGEPGYWDEYVEHSSSHTGEYESGGIYDLAMALDHLSLAAVGEGLGTCWIGGIKERAYRKILSIPDEVQARMVMLLGYPDESPDPRPRKSFEEVVCYERYS